MNRKAGLFRQKLEGLVAAHPEVFKGVRGSGLMLGLECVATNTDVVAAGYDAEVAVVPAAENVVRLLPPLIISDDEIGDAVARLDKAATAVKTAPPRHEERDDAAFSGYSHHRCGRVARDHRRRAAHENRARGPSARRGR